MIATAVTLAVLWFVGSMLSELVRTNGSKIVAALGGRSWAAQPGSDRPVTIRFSRPDRVAAPAPQPALRAAA